MKHSAIKILYVDDEVNNLLSFKSAFRRSFEIHTAATTEDARLILEGIDINIIVTDIRMPGESGIEFLESVIAKHPDPVRIVVTGYSDIQAVIDAINIGQVFRYVTKPWNEEELHDIIEKAYKVYTRKMEFHDQNERLRRANEQLEFQLRQILLD